MGKREREWIAKNIHGGAAHVVGLEQGLEKFIERQKTMMTRKNYEAAAKMIRVRYEQAKGLPGAVGEATAIREFCVALFREDNPAFNPARFREECMGEAKGKVGGTVSMSQ